MYERLNNYVMGFIYSPLLFITAYIETKQAQVIQINRRAGEQDENTIEEWEQMPGDIDFEGEGWAKKVDMTKPNVKTDATMLEIQELKAQVLQLTKMMEGIEGLNSKTNGSS